MDKIKTISSLDNEKIKYLNKLNNKKERDENQEFFIENLKTISDALRSGFKPRAVFVTEELMELKDPRVARIMEQSQEVYAINEKVNNKFSNLETPSGIAAIFPKLEGSINVLKKNIYLNAINDPGNLGTILRTALAFGFKNIIVDEHCADIYNSKTISASKDAIFKLNIISDKERQAFDKLKAKMKVYSTNLEGGQDPKIIKDKKYCLVFGSEASGVNQDILDRSDAFIRLEMSQEIESLNVAVAAGIVLYQLKELPI